MTCEQLRDVLPDFLYGELDPVARDAVEAHLQTCATCADTVKSLRRTQRALDDWVASDDGMTKSQLQAVISGDVTASRHRFAARHLMFSLMTGAIAAVLVFAALSSYESRSPLGEQIVSNPKETSNEFLLLLMERPSMLANLQSVKEDDLVREYQAWAGSVAVNNRTIVGKKLTDDRHLLGEDAPGAAPGSDVEAVAGYFRIGADSLEEAMTVARSCPHLKYGGRIEVRQVDSRTED